MGDNRNGNGKKAALAWTGIILAGVINIAAAVGYVVAVRVELNAIVKQLDRIEARLLYLERKP